MIATHETSELDEVQPESTRRPTASAVQHTDEPWPERPPILTPKEARELIDRWGAIQAGFVEAPEVAVEQADELVSEVVQQAQQAITVEREAIREELERTGIGSAQLSTEELRLALRRYRALLGRLLAL